jgi:hypothetical protein
LSGGPGLTRDAERLIARHLDSVGALDLLLLLYADPERAWTRDAVCAALACPPVWAQRELESMRRAGLAALNHGGYVFAPGSPRARAAVESVARVWRRDRAAVTRLIFAPRHLRADG